MCEVQWLREVCLHREVERRFAGLELCVERGAVPGLVLLRDELAAAEAELRWTESRREDGRVVNGHANWLVWHLSPKRRLEQVGAVAEELKVLYKESMHIRTLTSREAPTWLAL